QTMITSSSLILPSLLFALGIVVAFWITASLLSPLLGTRFLSFSWFSFKHLQQLSEQKKYNKAIEHLTNLQSAVEHGDFPSFPGLVLQALYLDFPIHTPELLAKVSHLHTDFLNAFIQIAHQRNCTVKNLPILEELFSDRSDLLYRALEARVARGRLEKKRSEKGKETPNWTRQEYQKKLDEVLDNLQTNTDSIRKQIDLAYKALSDATAEDSINETYH
ncbi:MAG: hypothetical protein KDD60_10870, partial [Bdellovibrionales bacterium]|nr:hypothetical protein [Bdellovibrionales bacterium]